MASTGIIDFEYFVTNLDWDDGTPLQYTAQPLIFDRSFNFTHHYAMPGFYKIKGLVFKKKLQTLNILPAATIDMGDIWDTYEITPASNDSDEFTILGINQPLGFLVTTNTKDSFINTTLNPNIDIGIDKPNGNENYYRLERIYYSASSITIENSTDDKNGSIAVQIPPWSSNRSRVGGCRLLLDTILDQSVYNFVDYSMELWLPDFGRVGYDGPTRYNIVFRAYDYISDSVSGVDWNTYEQNVDVLFGTNSWQTFQSTFFSKKQTSYTQILIYQNHKDRDRPSDNDDSWKFFIRNMRVKVPNEKNKVTPSQWEKFENNIIVNPSKNYLKSSPVYDHSSFMMIGGFTKKSYHFKNLMRLAGYDIHTGEKQSQTSYQEYNDFDVINILNNIVKYDRNLYDEWLDKYSEKIYSNGTLIHKGYVDEKKHGIFENTYITDVDVGNAKLYNGVKPMWEQLGFSSNSYDIPGENQYWKNIIPKDYTVLDRNGITKEPLDDPQDGALTPRVSREQYVIDESSNQNWKGGYRWPQLPSVDRFSILANDTGSHGHLVNQPDRIFFGSKMSWDGDDNLANITNLSDFDSDLIFHLTFTDADNENLEDTVDNFKVTQVTDYGVKLTPSNRITRGEVDGFDKIDTNPRQAF